MKMNKYKIKLVGYYAFSSEYVIVEGLDMLDALNTAKKLYSNAEDYLIIEIDND